MNGHDVLYVFVCVLLMLCIHLVSEEKSAFRSLSFCLLLI